MLRADDFQAHDCHWPRKWGHALWHVIAQKW
jgi:hypothetical protein